MKKTFIALLLGLGFIVAAHAQNAGREKPVWDHGDNVSKITYQNLQIYKILENADAYVVMYAKGGLNVGQVVLPKSWAAHNYVSGKARKLELRKKPGKLNPYMTVIKENGEFLKVWLTVPTSKQDPMWGIVANGTQLEGLDAETVNIEY